MLRFFSKIRLKLLGGSNLRKYVLYAIGEILLIMIGILLALQINNWNEQNKLSKSEAVYLNRLYEDVTKMKGFYLSRHESFTTGLSDAHRALDFLESCGEKKELEAFFKQTLLSHQQLINFIEFNSTFNEMLASGAFAQLKNTELKDAISSIYNWVKGSNDRVGYFRDELGRASAIINNFVSFSNKI